MVCVLRFQDDDILDVVNDSDDLHNMRRYVRCLYTPSAELSYVLGSKR